MEPTGAPVAALKQSVPGRQTLSPQDLAPGGEQRPAMQVQPSGQHLCGFVAVWYARRGRTAGAAEQGSRHKGPAQLSVVWRRRYQACMCGAALWPLSGCQHTSIERRVLITQNTTMAAEWHASSHGYASMVGGRAMGRSTPSGRLTCRCRWVRPWHSTSHHRYTFGWAHTQLSGYTRKGGGRHTCTRGLFVGASRRQEGACELEVAQPNTAAG